MDLDLHCCSGIYLRIMRGLFYLAIKYYKGTLNNVYRGVVRVSDVLYIWNMLYISIYLEYVIYFHSCKKFVIN